MTDLVKFPRTPHLTWLGQGAPRGDKLLSAPEAREWLARPCLVEEKVDGAGIGFSLGPDGRLRVQNRGNFVLRATAHPQFKPLWSWLSLHESALADALAPGLILYGEWLYARHTVAYDALPNSFLAFDVWDVSAGQFWSVARRNALCASAGIVTVPLLASGVLGLTDLESLMRSSRFSSGPAEGVYLRWEEHDVLVMRAKLVRRGWVQPDEEHWSKRPIEPNLVPSLREARHG